jgi:hypothetical protein
MMKSLSPVRAHGAPACSGHYPSMQRVLCARCELTSRANGVVVRPAARTAGAQSYRAASRAVPLRRQRGRAARHDAPHAGRARVPASAIAAPGDPAYLCADEPIQRPPVAHCNARVREGADQANQSGGVHPGASSVLIPSRATPSSHDACCALALLYNSRSLTAASTVARMQPGATLRFASNPRANLRFQATGHSSEQW